MLEPSKAFRHFRLFVKIRTGRIGTNCSVSLDITRQTPTRRCVGGTKRCGSVYPPVLHPSVKRLLLMSPMFTERHLRRIFPSEKVAVVRTEPIAWIPGSRVFQLRTGIYSLRTILNYDSNWDVLGLSKRGERLLFDIRTEIDRDPRVKHAIITNRAITRHLTDLSAKENVCFTANFKELNNVDFEAVEVLWIVGTPALGTRHDLGTGADAVWQRCGTALL